MISGVSRVEVIGRGEFDSREWLRREVLWASLMVPYSVQAKTWLNGTAIVQHNGSVMRQKIYQQEPDIESQSLAFFNHGKNIGGIVSSAVLFRVSMDKSREGAYVDILGEQAGAIERIISRKPEDFITETATEEVSYEECARLVQEIQGETNPHINNGRRLRASNVMSALACREAKDWVASSLQNEDQSLPVLTIQDGGFPRSAGDRVERLQPVFHRIIESAQYRALSQD
jgi:hypothetical protein